MNKENIIKDLVKEINFYTGADVNQVYDLVKDFKSKLKNKEFVTLIREEIRNCSDKEDIIEFISLDPLLLLSFTEISENAIDDLSSRASISHFESKKLLEAFMERLYDSIAPSYNNGKITRNFGYLKKRYFKDKNNLENIIYNLVLCIRKNGYDCTMLDVKEDFSIQDIKDFIFLHINYPIYCDYEV